MEIAERNWRSRYGEANLIAAGGDWLVFVEVKTRRGLGYGGPAEAVTFSKQRRIRLLAVEWRRDSGRSASSLILRWCPLDSVGLELIPCSIERCLAAGH